MSFVAIGLTARISGNVPTTDTDKFAVNSRDGRFDHAIDTEIGGENRGGAFSSAEKYASKRRRRNTDKYLVWARRTDVLITTP
jgi:hypothetical protein